MSTPNRTPAGVPTGGQFAASTKPESDVALTEPPRPESVNLVTNREWIASMPLDVRIALASIEGTGAAVNEFEDGAIFYEAEVDFVGMPANIGSAVGYVTDAIEKYCARYDQHDPERGRGTSEDVIKVCDFIRTDTIRSPYYEGLARLMRWVGTDTSRFDDED